MATKTTMSLEEAFAILGIDQNWSLEAAQEVYKKLASANHPDKHQGIDKKAECTEFMQQLNVAWGKAKETLKTEEELEQEEKAQAEKEKAAKARQKSKAKQKIEKECIIRDDGQSAVLSGTFFAHELIELLYAIGQQHMENIGDCIKNSAEMVDFFRALSTARNNKVHSLALLNEKSRLIRLEELTDESPSIKAIATQAVIHGASSVYLVVNSPDGAIPKAVNPAQKNKADDIKKGLEVLGVKFLDFLIVGQHEHFSVLSNAAIARD